MKITFSTDHKVKQPDGNGPHYKTGETVEFNGPVAETYARKYIARGWAVEAVEPAPKPAAKEKEPVPALQFGTEGSAASPEPTVPPPASASQAPRGRFGRGRSEA